MAAIDQLASRQLEIVSQLLASRELQSAAHIIAQEGNEIANITFIRGSLLILLWVISYVAGKLIYDYIKYRIARSRQQV